MSRNPTIEATRTGDDAEEEQLRPQSFDAFVGQETTKQNLQVMVESAQKRAASLDHILLHGPPGLGKTTLAHIIASEMEVELHVTSGPAMEKPGDLAGILTALEEGDILFIDECHRMNTVVEENLYPAMEDYYFDIVLGEGPHAQSMKLTLPPFTLVGATTRKGLLSSPLRGRFGYDTRLEYYDRERLEHIVKRSARIIDIGITDQGAREIARRSRGTPRIANRLLNRVRDYAVVDDKDTIDADIADYALKRLEVDSAGFDDLDRLYLDTLVVKFSGGPAGLETLAASIGEEKDTIAEVVEPYLLQEGYIRRSSQGRLATKAAFEHLGVPFQPSQDTLL